MARQHSWNNKYNNVDQNNVFVIYVSSLVEVSVSHMVYSSGIHIWDINGLNHSEGSFQQLALWTRVITFY